MHRTQRPFFFISIQYYVYHNILKYINFSSILSSLQTNLGTIANSADPDEMALNEPSHQDLQFAVLLLIFDKPFFAIMDESTFRDDGPFHKVRGKGSDKSTCITETVNRV